MELSHKGNRSGGTPVDITPEVGRKKARRGLPRGEQAGRNGPESGSGRELSLCPGRDRRYPGP